MTSEFPLFCFTTLAGLAAGSYAIAAAFPLGKESRRAWLLPLACLVLLAVGMLGLPAHLGRPERMLGALAQPSAMIAQEAYWSAAFGVVVAIDLVLSMTGRTAPRVLRVLGAAFGVALACVMANAYFVSLAVPAWASWTTFPLFVVGDLAMGAALAFALGLAMRRPASQPVVAGGNLEAAVADVAAGASSGATYADAGCFSKAGAGKAADDPASGMTGGSANDGAADAVTGRAASFAVDTAGLRLFGKGAAFFAVQVALAGLAALSFLVEALQFSAVGLSPAPFVLAAVAAVASMAVVAAARKGRLSKSRVVWPAFACMFFAVAIARYAFYAVCSF